MLVEQDMEKEMTIGLHLLMFVDLPLIGKHNLRFFDENQMKINRVARVRGRRSVPNMGSTPSVDANGSYNEACGGNAVVFESVALREDVFPPPPRDEDP